MTVARGGRLPDAIDAAMERLNTSVDIDWELWREDIAGSIAHAEGLARAGVLTNTEALSIVTGLQQIKGEIERGEFFWDRKKEDVHMNIEARLRDVVGPVGGKLHTGRSRTTRWRPIYGCGRGAGARKRSWRSMSWLRPSSTGPAPKSSC